jgi:hypothetical protein
MNRICLCAAVFAWVLCGCGAPRGESPTGAKSSQTSSVSVQINEITDIELGQEYTRVCIRADRVQQRDLRRSE